MTNTPKGTNPLGSLTRSLWFVAAVWTTVLGGSLWWNLRSQREGIREVARFQALSEWRKDVLYRRWNAQHSPVYVPLTPETPSNPFLADVPERDIEAPSGRKLTLINPAYMTRQVHELGQADGVVGHITSLLPIRPQNAPDPWEKRALETLAAGAKECFSVEPLDGGPHLRLMRPLVTEKSCLTCHATQGYKVGDLRGGISVAVPLRPLLAAAEPHRRSLIAGHAVLWGIGLAALLLGGRSQLRLVQARLAAEAENLELERRLSESRRLNAVGTLTSGIAHQFNNLLTVILGRAELARDEAAGGGRATRDLDAILDAGARASTLVEKMSSLTGWEVDVAGEAAVRECLRRVLAAVDLRLPAQVEVRERICPDAVVAIAPAQLETVLRNLLSNAADAIGPTGGEIVFEVEPWAAPLGDSISGADQKHGREAFRIVVQDSGCGMTAEVLARVFEPFFTTKEVGSGDGLGLPLARAVVQRHGGRIEVESEEGKGTRVSVWLPAARQARLLAGLSEPVRSRSRPGA